MFGSTRKSSELEQKINLYRSALLQVAEYVGLVVGPDQAPERIAADVCACIDGFAGNKEPKVHVPGSEFRPILASVSKIKLGGAVDVVLRQGEDAKLEVFSNDAGDLSKVLTDVSGDCLTVDSEPMGFLTIGGRGVTQVFKGGVCFTTGNLVEAGMGRRSGQIAQHPVSLGLRVVLTLPSVNDIRLSGAGDLSYQEIDLEELSLKISGAGDIHLAGKVISLDAAVSGAGNIDARLLTAVEGRFLVSGAGNIEATTTESVSAKVSGVGNIRISGKPVSRATHVSGLGKIRFV